MLRHQHDENLFHLLFWQSITYNFLAKVEIMRRQSVKYHLMHKKDTIESHRSINLSSIQFMSLLGVDPIPRAYHMATTVRELWLAVFLSGNDLALPALCPKHIQSVSDLKVDILMDIHVMVKWQLSKRVSADQCHLTVLRELIEVTCFLMLSPDLWFFLIDASSGL